MGETARESDREREREGEREGGRERGRERQREKDEWKIGFCGVPKKRKLFPTFSDDHYLGGLTTEGHAAGEEPKWSILRSAEH